MVGNRRARNAAPEVGGVQPDRGALLARHLVGDPAGHHVPRSELGGRVDVEHEPPAVGVDQRGPLPADRLGDQEVARGGQGGGMELVELQVRHRCAGAQGDGDPVTGGDLGVRGVAVELAGAAGGQDHGVGGQLGAVQQPYADRAPVVQHHVDDGGAGPQRDARVGHPPQQRGRDRLAGGVAVHVQDPGVLVGGLQTQGQARRRRWCRSRPPARRARAPRPDRPHRAPSPRPRRSARRRPPGCRRRGWPGCPRSR